MKIRRLYWVQQEEIIDLEDPDERNDFSYYIIQDEETAEEIIKEMESGRPYYYGFEDYGAEPVTSETFIPITENA